MGHFPEKLFCRYCIPVQPSKMLLSIKTSGPFASTPLQQACEATFRFFARKIAASSAEQHMYITLQHSAAAPGPVVLESAVEDHRRVGVSVRV